MNVKNDKPTMKLKLSLKKETLRPLSDSDLQLLDAVVGGTDGGGSCGRTCIRTVIAE
jgi:hypothetical protein